MPENTNTAPIVSPLLALFRSRKFLLTFIGIVLDLLIVFLPPDTAPSILALREELLLAVTGLIGVLIGGIAYEDGNEKGAPVIETQNVTVMPPLADDDHEGDTRPLVPTAYPPPSKFG